MVLGTLKTSKDILIALNIRKENESRPLLVLSFHQPTTVVVDKAEKDDFWKEVVFSISIKSII